MLIYEKNDIELNELHRSRGYYDSNPLMSFFSHVLDDIGEKEFRKIFKRYYGKIVGLDLSNVKEQTVEHLYFHLSEGKFPNGRTFKVFAEYDKINGLAYYIAEKYLKLKPSGLGLSYYLDKIGSSHSYYFFDTYLELFVGMMEVIKSKLSNFSGKIYDVQTSAAERRMIGLGYGTKMYLTILENCDYLVSSSVLFTGSYRIWSQVLPKYANVWWKKDDSDVGIPKVDYDIIDPNKTFSIPAKNIEHFVASIYHKKIS